MLISSFSPHIPGESIELVPHSSAASYQHPGAVPQDPRESTERTHQQSGISTAASSLPQTVPGQQLQARGGKSRVQAGSAPVQLLQGQSPQAHGFPELTSSQTTPQMTPPGASCARSRASGSREEEDQSTMEGDVLKGVSQAVRNALADEGYSSQYDHPSTQNYSLSPTLSEPSSLESLMKSMSLVDIGDTDIEEYKLKMPKPLKVDYYDAMILYQEDDKNAVERFLKRVDTEVLLQKQHKPLVALYDQILPSDSGMSPIGELDFILPYCTYVLLYVTKDFCTDAWTEFSSQTCLMDAIHNPEKRWSVVPIFTEPKRNTSFKVPPSVRSLKGIQYWSDDKFYVDSLRKLLEDKLHVRKKKEADHRTERINWIRQEKGEEIRHAEERRQSELHAKQKESLRMKQHAEMMQAKENRHQKLLQERDRWQKQIQNQTPNEYLQNMETLEPSPKRDNSYMQSLYRHHLYNPNVSSNPVSLPASLDQFGKTYSPGLPQDAFQKSYGHPHALQQSYSVPYGSHPLTPAYPSPGVEMSSLFPERFPSGVQQAPPGPDGRPCFSLGPDGSQGDVRFPEAAGPEQQQPSVRSATFLSSQQSQHQGDASHSPGSVGAQRCTSSVYRQGSQAADQGSLRSFAHPGSSQPGAHGFNPDGHLPSSAREPGGLQSMPGQMGDPGQLSQRQGDSQSAAGQFVPARVSTAQLFNPLPATASSCEKEVAHAVQPDVGGLGQQHAEGFVQGHSTPSSGQGDAPEASYQQQQVKQEENQKDDLVEDFPPESHTGHGQEFTAHAPETKPYHTGQPHISEAVAQPVLTARGPGHHTSSRSRAEPIGMEDPLCGHPQQYSAEGPEVIGSPGNVPQPHQFPQWRPHNYQSWQPGLQYARDYRGPPPAYAVYPQQFPTGQAASHPLVFPGQHQPYWPPQVPYLQVQQQYPGFLPPSVFHHHHFHDGGERVPTTTINIVKTAENVMIGSEITVGKKRMIQPSRRDNVEPLVDPQRQDEGEAYR